jgi:hypothetical protein
MIVGTGIGSDGGIADASATSTNLNGKDWMEAASCARDARTMSRPVGPLFGKVEQPAIDTQEAPNSKERETEFLPPATRKATDLIRDLNNALLPMRIT